MLKVIINNKNYYFTESMTVLQACEKINIHIPKFCYHDKLSIAGNCRMCLVEIEKSPKPIASCAMPLSNNMKIFTESPLVKKARENTLESLLINHPLDCPICDQGGECDLQDQTLNFGLDKSRFFEFKRGVEDKELGPVIKTIMTRCIHCTKCIRFCNEILGQEFLGTLGRSSKTEIGSYINKFVKNELSGNLIDLCPVGALTSKPYAFTIRPWELNSYDCIDFNDAFGSNVKVYTRTKLKSKNLLKDFSLLKSEDRIMRILPRLNEDINECWISDKTRFFYDSNNINRLSHNFLKKNYVKKINWYETIDILKYKFNNIEHNKNLSVFGKSIDIENCFIFFKFSKSIGVKNFLLNNQFFDNDINYPQNYLFNDNFSNLSKKGSFILINTNLRFESSILNLKLRKNKYKNNSKIYLLGFFNQNFYDINQIGFSIYDIIKFIEGKFLLNKSIKNNKSINILYSDFFINNYVYFFDKKNLFKKLLLLSYNNMNVVYNNITNITLNELGIKNYSHSKKKQSFETILSFKTSFSDFDLLKSLKDIIDFNSHKNILQSKYNNIISIPLPTFYEQNIKFCNMRGDIQNSKKSLSFYENSKPFLYIINMILNKKTSKNFIKKKHLFNTYPSLIEYKSLKFNLINFEFKSLKRNKEFICQNLIKNFFRTNLYSENSLLLSDCSLFLNLNQDFKKI